MPSNASHVKDTVCPTPGCTGVGHIEGARYASHTTVDTCPYSGQNLHRESPAFPDRLAGEEVDSVPATLSSATEPQKEEAKESTRGNKHRATPKAEPEAKEARDVASPTPQKLEPEPKKSKLSPGEPEAKKSKSSPSADLAIKSEPEVESAKVSEAESRAESPAAEQNYDSAEAASPSPKKPYVNHSCIWASVYS